MKRVSSFTLSLTLTLTLILTGSVLAIQAAPPTLEPPPPRPLRGELEELPFLDSGLSGLGSQEEVGATGLADWSKIVFQSYRDGNWEIYLANGDGSNQTRLTNHSASDLYPRLNRGCTRIVFASNRTGNYEIFTMNPDGSGLTQLTSNGADDVNPSWSPDGAKIAFQSYRDGQAEIYVINTNGSGQTRLTSDGAYDGMPAWSPDGTKIAFVSTRTGGYRIWVMNADGSGQTQHSTQPYSENPVWSPDGSQIAYDSDGDGDGWQELWLMDADGSNQREVYDTYGYQTDAWARSWSPDGRYVAFTRISFVYYQGNWYWTEAYLDAWDVNVWSTIRLSSQGTDWRPDWQTADAWAPRSSAHTLPVYSRGAPTISWSGSDSGGSRIQTYDVQYRDTAGGGWTDWQTGTTNTSATFSGTAGHTYYFRSRATDNAHNVESWPSGDRDTYTTLYTWAVAGTVRDNRDTPLGGAIVTTTPGAFEASPSDDDGNYAAYVADSASTYIVTWSKSGYGDLPATGFGAVQDACVDAILPPGDNAVLNWGFEANGGSLSGWDIGGEFTPTVTTDTWHTGRAAASLEQDVEPELAPPEALWGGGCTYPDIAVDREGVVHVAYANPSSGVFYSYRTVQGEWIGPVKAGTCGDWHEAVLPVIAVTPSGDIHIVWNGEAGIYYSHSLPDGFWAEQIVIGPGNRCQYPDAAADSQGGLHVVYYCWYMDVGQRKIYYRYRSPSRTWADAEFLGEGTEPGIVVGPHDVIHVWYDGHHIQRALNGQWGTSEPIPCGDQITVDREGTLHAICSNTHGYYTSKSPGGTWSELVELPKYYGSGDLAVDSEGTVYVVTNSYAAGEEHTYFRYKRVGQEWTAPVAIGEDYHGRPVIVVDQSDNIHLMYEEWLANIYRTNVRSPFMAVSAISQTITLSTDLYHPTLSFLYRLHGTSSRNPDAFKVFLSDGMTSTVVFSTTGNVDWTHAWVDLSPWAGQTITMVMASQTISGENYTRLSLDEVTVGSAYPDLWGRKSGSVAALPGEQVVHAIAYGNRGGAAASGVRITETLPGELFFVDASPLPITTTPSLVWDVGDLPAKSGPFNIVVTATVAPTATMWSSLTNTVSIEATSPELETVNNVAHAAIFVGRHIYLPVAMKGYSE